VSQVAGHEAIFSVPIRGSSAALGAGETVQTIVVALAIGILLAIAYHDIRTRRIPNALTAAIALLGLARLILADNLVAAMYTLLASALVFAAAFLLFWRGILGGGDAKLVAAMALLVGAHHLLDFLFIMSACGGGLGLAIMASNRFDARRHQNSSQLTGPQSLHVMEPAPPPAGATVPYGVAIAGAGVVMLFLRPVL
jgi:prepilin peptidase CpaA